MKKILFFFVGFVLLGIGATTVTAAALDGCQPIYGGSESCAQNSPVTVNNQVLNPQTNQYVESLPANGAVYQTGSTIRFKITVTNPTNNKVDNIELFTFMPQYIEFVKGEGTYDKAKKILNTTLNTLASKQSKTYIIEGKIIADEKLPKNQSSLCLINQALVEADNKTSQDNTLFCIGSNGTTIQPTVTPPPAKVQAAQKNTVSQTTKGGLPIYTPPASTSTPDTGPGLITIPSLTALLFMGFYMRSKAKT